MIFIKVLFPAPFSVAKTVNFGVIYGISPFGLSETLSISREEAKKYIEQYFLRHPGVKDYIAKCIGDAKDKGYVVTLFRRKRAVPEILSRNSGTRQLGERLAINSPIQGTAADIIKIAMINIRKIFIAQNIRSKMILQVHDELLSEIREQVLEAVKAVVKKEMEGVITLSVPLSVSISYGKRISFRRGLPSCPERLQALRAVRAVGAGGDRLFTVAGAAVPPAPADTGTKKINY